MHILLFTSNLPLQECGNTVDDSVQGKTLGCSCKCWAVCEDTESTNDGQVSEYELHGIHHLFWENESTMVTASLVGAIEMTSQ